MLSTNSCVSTNAKTLLWEAPCSLWNIANLVLVKEIPSNALVLLFCFGFFLFVFDCLVGWFWLFAFLGSFSPAYVQQADLRVLWDRAQQNAHELLSYGSKCRAFSTSKAIPSN